MKSGIEKVLDTRGVGVVELFLVILVFAGIAAWLWR